MKLNPNVSRVSRCAFKNTLRLPDLLPADLARFIESHGDLVLEGEHLTLDDLAERIKGCTAGTHDVVMANRLKAWANMALALLDHTADLPDTLTHAGLCYPKDLYARRLGNAFMQQVAE